MNKGKEYRTDFLFATPDYLIGAGSVFNIAGNYFEFNTSATGEIADQNALESDWGVVGQDLKGAISEYELQLNDAE